MKTSNKLLVLLLIVSIMLSLAVSCKKDEPDDQGGSTLAPWVDIASEVKLDMTSSTKKVEATVKSFIDGDTTHFYCKEYVDERVAINGALKARYLAINTPESTGKIEEWGKAASRFTRSRLEQAVSIILESDNEKWNIDSTGERHLVWVWYKTAEDTEYRNLNIEILEAGLAAGSKAGSSRYGEIANAAINQAIQEKLYIFSDNIDPDFPYGEAISVTLKELRTNTAEYSGQKVSVEGTVVYNDNYTVYIEAFDAESNISYGMQVFYGYNTSLHSVFAQGNKVRVVGVVSDFHGTWQISGLSYNPMRPNDPANTAVIEKGDKINFTEIEAKDFYSDVTVEVNEEMKTYKFHTICISTAVAVKDLKVIDMYTTKNGDSAGAITITCRAEDGTEIDVRTEVLKDADGNVVTEQYFKNKTIDVQGLIEYFDLNNTGDGTYQIKVYTLSDVTVH